MFIGYARTSTIDQRAGYEAQLKSLSETGCTKVFKEQVSSVGDREQLDAALDFVRDGDTLVVARLDRLARSTADLLQIAEALKTRGANLKILDLELDTATATGKLLFTMVGAIAEFERQLMLERQREGIARAKTAGKYKGRKPTARAKADQVVALKEQGVGATEIAKRLTIGRASVYRILADREAA
jgi:DNA invertase Pin-like site-specific DNA recombinase